MLYNIIFFFFFQAEDGIRDLTVTGVQTCALPIVSQIVAEMVSPVSLCDVGGNRHGRAPHLLDKCVSLLDWEPLGEAVRDHEEIHGPLPYDQIAVAVHAGPCADRCHKGDHNGPRISCVIISPPLPSFSPLAPST